MAIYRQQRRISPRLLILIAGIVIATTVIVLLVATRPAAAPVDPVAATKTKALEIAQGLDILTVEYPQASQGAELSGVKGSLSRAKLTFEGAKNELMKLDSAVVDQLAADFATLEQKVNDKAPADEVVALAEKMKTALIALSK